MGQIMSLPVSRFIRIIPDPKYSSTPVCDFSNRKVYPAQSWVDAFPRDACFSHSNNSSPLLLSIVLFLHLTILSDSKSNSYLI